jgi:hypothetical protein
LVILQWNNVSRDGMFLVFCLAVVIQMRILASWG